MVLHVEITGCLLREIESRAILDRTKVSSLVDWPACWRLLYGAGLNFEEQYCFLLACHSI